MGPKDARIRFSKSWTLLNFFLSSLQILGCAALFYHHSYEHCIEDHDHLCESDATTNTEVIKFILSEIEWFRPNFKHLSFKYITGIMFVLHISIGVITTLF